MILTETVYARAVRCERSLFEEPCEPDDDRSSSIELGPAVLPNATFRYEVRHAGLGATVDAVYEKRGKRYAVLFAPGTGVRARYLDELEFCRYVFAAAGFQIDFWHVYHIDKNYVRNAELEPGALFVVADVSNRLTKRGGVEQRISRYTTLLEAGDPSGAQPCGKRTACPYCGATASRDIDDPTTLHKAGRLPEKLAEDGIFRISAIPAEYRLSPTQRIQREAVISGREHRDLDSISRFLEMISFPAILLDFEAISSAIPPFPGTRPWEHVPFLFVTRILTRPPSESTTAGADRDDEKPEKWAVVSPERDDRVAFVEALLEATAGTGSIVSYGAEFESRVFRRLAELFPSYASALIERTDRIVDLLEPFGSFAYYHPDQRGKCSLKVVLPIITDGGYHGLEISDGGDANAAYRRLLSGRRSGTPEPDEADVIDALRRYCRQDVHAMDLILSALSVL